MGGVVGAEYGQWDGDGYGDGSGYGRGRGRGDGYGCWSGFGDGSGFGTGDGFGTGTGFGDGTGTGTGNGFGDGDEGGDGTGHGSSFCVRRRSSASTVTIGCVTLPISEWLGEYGQQLADKHEIPTCAQACLRAWLVLAAADWS